MTNNKSDAQNLGFINKPSLSFEFFAPKDESSFRRLQHSYKIAQMSKAKFVSLTLNAGGKNAAEQLSCEHIKVLKELCCQPSPMVSAHITCVKKSKAVVDSWLEDWWSQGVKSFVILRGDNKGLSKRFEPHAKGYKTSLELIASVRKRFGSRVTIYVSAYPESHPDSLGEKSDLDYLKKKFDLGADVAISQFFFLPETFLKFRDKAIKHGIQQSIMPGILPIHNFKKVEKFALSCGSSIPQSLRSLHERLLKNQHDITMYRKVVVEQCADLCRKLITEGVNHLHFYTLNLPNLVTQVLNELQLINYKK